MYDDDGKQSCTLNMYAYNGLGLMTPWAMADDHGHSHDDALR
jgi:hypothetical protein